mgnify:FL=1
METPHAAYLYLHSNEQCSPYLFSVSDTPAEGDDGPDYTDSCFRRRSIWITASRVKSRP